MEEEKWKLLVLLLKEIAKEKGITQYQIALKADLKESSVNRFFSLRVCPMIDTFVKIAAAVGINFNLKTKDGEKLDFARLLKEAKKNYK